MRLALLPGLDGTGLLFEPLLASLPSELNPLVVRYDNRYAGSISGHVESGAEALSGRDEWLVLAESFSGPIAARIVTEHSELNIRGIIFAASFLSPPRRPCLRILRHAPLKTLFDAHMPGWLIRSLCLGQQADRASMDLFRKALSSAGSTALAKRLRLLSDLPPFTERISVPSLYLRPTQDRLVPASSMREIARLCPRMTPYEMDGPHFILQARPSRCSEAIATFAEKIVFPERTSDRA